MKNENTKKLGLVKDYVRNLAEATKDEKIKPIIVMENGDWDYDLQDYYTREDLVKYYGDYSYDYTLFEKDYVGDGRQYAQIYVLTIYIDNAFYERNRDFVISQKVKWLRKFDFLVYLNDQNEIIGIKSRKEHYVAFNREKVLATQNEEIIKNIKQYEKL